MSNHYVVKKKKEERKNILVNNSKCYTVTIKFSNNDIITFGDISQIAN